MLTLKLTLLSVMVWFASCAAGNQPPQSAPAAPPAAAPAVPQAPSPRAAEAIDPALDALLTKLESSAKELTSFAAKIAYEKEDAILMRTETRTGEIIYRIDNDRHNKAFAVLFNSRIVGNRKENRLYHYIFDGRWLAEIDHENKQFIKREIVEPGKVLDPLKLGEGPFPLPVGQAKADVLERFTVSAIEVPTAGLLKTLKDVDGVRLTPKAGTREADDYERVDIFYDRATSLPVGIEAVETNGDRKTVKLTDLKRNPEMDEAMTKKLDIAEPDPKQWKIDIQPWRVGP